MKYLVSSCLVGMNCKYNGENNYNEKIINFLKDKQFVIACPEQMGGLQTPRAKSEIVGKEVITEFGENVTGQYEKGALETLKIAKIFNCTHAILKEKSPSCGVHMVYDGTFSGIKIQGMGRTAELLTSESIIVLSEDEIDLE
ncbi:MAG: DUF523 domain-containing protein [Clostridiales bacterium]|nr:DUF523 domain-containing protein [Clostridiales bacterium]